VPGLPGPGILFRPAYRPGRVRPARHTSQLRS